MTASHNPPEDNGLKIWLGEGTAGEKDLLSIRNILERGDYEQGTGMSSSFDVTPSYIEDIVRRLGSCRPFRVVRTGETERRGRSARWFCVVWARKSKSCSANRTVVFPIIRPTPYGRRT